METVTTPIIADGVLAELAEKASACRYSVLRRYVGLPVRGRVAARIDAVLAVWREEARQTAR